MFLSMRHKIGLPQFLCILHVLSMLSKKFKWAEIQHDIYIYILAETNV